MDEIEQERQSLVAARDADAAGRSEDWRVDFQPGTFGCHEALHLAHVFAADIEEHLAKHPAIMLNQDWYMLAARAVEALAKLYQEIGKSHLQSKN